MNVPDNCDDIIDSRDVIAAIDELSDDAEERDALMHLAQAGEESFNDWHDGVTLVRDSYFQSYAMDYAAELDLIPSEYSWPSSCINWEKAARELRMDYMPVEFDGVTYWAR